MNDENRDLKWLYQTGSEWLCNWRKYGGRVLHTMSSDGTVRIVELIEPQGELDAEQAYWILLLRKWVVLDAIKLALEIEARTGGKGFGTVQ